jgi:altronate hydrolase
MHIQEERTAQVEDQGWQAPSPVIRLHASDDVVIARHQLMSGTRVADENIVVAGLIPAGHKMATRAIAKGDPVHRYNQIIGIAKQDIRPGQHVHTHNLAMTEYARDHAFCVDARPTDYVAQPATFMGIVRPDGRVATRNYIGILTSVNCSATVARAIADYFRRDIRPEALADYPNVDGVVALTHGGGCAIDTEGEGIAILRRTLAGYALHPNFAAVLIVGLGCEANQIDGIVRTQVDSGPQAANLHDPGDGRHGQERRTRHRAGQGITAGREQGGA